MCIMLYNELWVKWQIIDLIIRNEDILHWSSRCSYLRVSLFKQKLHPLQTWWSCFCLWNVCRWIELQPGCSLLVWRRETDSACGGQTYTNGSWFSLLQPKLALYWWVEAPGDFAACRAAARRENVIREVDFRQTGKVKDLHSTTNSSRITVKFKIFQEHFGPALTLILFSFFGIMSCFSLTDRSLWTQRTNHMRPNMPWERWVTFTYLYVFILSWCHDAVSH